MNPKLDVSLSLMAIETLDAASPQHGLWWNHARAIVDSPFEDLIYIASFAFAAAR